MELLKWLYPGMRVKRWLFLALCSLLLAALGVDLIMEGNLFGYLAQPIHNLEFRVLDQGVHLVAGVFLLVTGLSVIAWGS